MTIIKFKRGTTYPVCEHGEPAFITTNNHFIVGNSSSGVWVGAEINPVLGTSQNQLCTHFGIKTYVDNIASGVVLASGVNTFTALNTFSAGISSQFIVTNSGTFGTPTQLIGTNITGTATSFTSSNVTTNANLTGHITSVGNAAILGSFSSSQLSTALTDETGSGSAVFATSPTLVTPSLGTPTSGNLTNCTFPTLNQNTTGSAATLTTSRDINGTAFNGSANITVTANAGTLTGTTLASNVVASSLTSVGTLTNITVDGTLTLGTSALISSPSATALVIKSEVQSGIGVTPTIQIICPSASTALTNGSTVQNVFSPTGYDTISVQASTTYMFEGIYIIKTTGTTTHQISMNFAGTATLSSISWLTYVHTQSAPPQQQVRTQDSNFFIALGGGTVGLTNYNMFNVIKFDGMLRADTIGTIVPQITFSAAPGGSNTLETGSYLRFYPIGSNAIDSVGTAIG